MFETQYKRIYPSECNTEDTKRLQTQIRVFKRWLNGLLKQANTSEVKDLFEIFVRHEKLWQLCNYLGNQKSVTTKMILTEDIANLEASFMILERLYGSEIVSVIQTTVAEFTHLPSQISVDQLLNDYVPNSRSDNCNLLFLGLDTLWILAVAIRAGTGPTTNLIGSLSSSGSTITRRSHSIASTGHSAPANLISASSPSVDRWLVSQDKRLLAWCVAVTEGYTGINVTNFTHSWRDGLVFLAVVHQIRPEHFTFESRFEKTANQNLSLAFHLATSEFATPRLLEPIDMRPENIDARATALYIMELRRAVERDRKRRSRGILEIQTSNMNQGSSNSEANVTVETRLSPTSTCSNSEFTWLDNEVEGDSDEEDSIHLPDPDLFTTMIETTLAWLLAMEERFEQNDLHEEDRSFPGAPAISRSEQFQAHQNEEDKKFISRLQKSSSIDGKSMHKEILKNIDVARNKFETHEDLTAHVSRRQMAVARCLRLGNRLIQTHCNKESLSLFNLNNELFTNEEKQKQTQILDALMTIDPNVIQRQTALLATRWNNLCRLNSAIGKRITNHLMRRQTMLLSAIRIQLEKLELEQTGSYNQSVGPSIGDVKKQLEANRKLEQLIEFGEALVERLDNFITIVPQQDPDRDENYEPERGLENTIAELATRWSRIVNWVNTRYAHLQNVLLHWRHFEEEANLLSDWLTERADEVARLTANITLVIKGNDVGDQIASSHSRQNSIDNAHQQGDNRSITEQILDEAASYGSFMVHPQNGNDRMNEDNMQAIIAQSEVEMEAIESCLAPHESRWAQLLASLDRRAQAIRDACGDTDSVSRLVEKIVDQLVSRWSQLRDPQFPCEDWPEKDLRSVEAYVESTTRNELLSSCSNSVTKYQDSFGENKRPADNFLNVPKASKISRGDTQAPPSPTGYRAEFESKAEELLNWLDNCAEALELITMEKRRALEAGSQTQTYTSHFLYDTSGLSEPTKVLSRIAKEIEEFRTVRERVLILGEQYREELSLAGENVDELDQLFDEVEERWTYLEKLLSKANNYFQDEIKLKDENSKSDQNEQNQTEIDDNNNNSNTNKNQNINRRNDDPVTPNILSPKCETECSTESQIFQQNVIKKIEDINSLLNQVKELVSVPVSIGHGEDADDKISSLNKLLKDIESATILLKNLETNPPPGVDTTDLETKLQKLREQYEIACTKIMERTNLMQELAEQHELFLNQFEGIEKWLADMSDYLDSVSRAHLPSVPVILAQLQESCEALNDMKTLKPTLDKVDEFASRLMKYFSQSYAQLITNRLQRLHTDWNQIKCLTRQNRDQLKSKLDEASTPSGGLGNKTSTNSSSNPQFCGSTSPLPLNLQQMGSKSSQNVTNQSNDTLNRESNTNLKSGALTNSQTSNIGHQTQLDIVELDKWMHETRENLKCFTLIETESDFTKFKNLIQIIDNMISEYRPKLAILDAPNAVNLTGQAISDTEALLTKAYFADLESAVAAERERLLAAIYHLNDFNTLLNAEKRWFETVDKLVGRIKSSEYADLNELSDDLEVLESITGEHSLEDEQRLHQLANSLTESKIMSIMVDEEITNYNANLEQTKSKLNNSNRYIHGLMNDLQSTEANVNEIENLLSQLESDMQVKTVDESCDTNLTELCTEWKNSIMKADSTIAELEELLIRFSLPDSNRKCLIGRIENMKSQLQDHIEPLRKVVVQLIHSSDYETHLHNLCQELKNIENELCLLDIASVDPEDIRCAIKNAKEFLSTLNQLKTDLSYIVDKNRTVCSQTKSNDNTTQIELNSLSEQHQSLVTLVLVALEELNRCLPVIEKLDCLMSQIHESLLSIEEVTDYLETTDCPISRTDLLQKVYFKLVKLCDKAGTIEQIQAILTNVKSYTVAGKCVLTENIFTNIENQLEIICWAKDTFKSYLNQANNNNNLDMNFDIMKRELKFRINCTTENIGRNTMKSHSVEPLQYNDNKPSLNCLITDLLKPEAKISNTVRVLAREIRTHFQNIILFNRCCLGIKSILPGSETKLINKSVTKMENGVVETSISERKAMVKIYFLFTENLFAQQRQYLEIRLRDLIVNSGNNDSSDRLEDLLNLQSLWYETNAKLDKRLEQMLLLEKQLTSVEDLFNNYMKSPSEQLRSQYLNEITNIEETYGWKLNIDRERIENVEQMNDKSLVNLRNKCSNIDQLSNNKLLTAYEKQLQSSARFLNSIHSEILACTQDLAAQIGAHLERLEEDFTACEDSISDSAKTLNQLTLEIDNLVNDENGSLEEKQLNDNFGDLIWLKLLLTAQKNRFENYAEQYESKKGVWYERFQLWQSFNIQLDQIKSAYFEIHELEQAETANCKIEEKIKDLCFEFSCLREQGLRLIDTDPQMKNPTSTESSLESEPKSEIDGVVDSKDKPPSIPPRGRSLYRGYHNQSYANDNEFVRHELEQLENKLISLCQKFGTESSVTTNVSVASIIEMQFVNESTKSLDSYQKLEKQPVKIITINGVPELPVKTSSASSSDVNYLDGIRACLTGIIESIKWFIEEAYLVPTNIEQLMLQNSDIEISKSVYDLDAKFWSNFIDSTEIKDLEKSIEITNNWIQMKYEHLRYVEEKSTEWQSCLITFHEDAKTSLKYVYELGRNQEKLEHRNVIKQLEFNCSKVDTVLQLACSALQRRRQYLDDWQSNLSTFNDFIKQIEINLLSIDSVYELIRDNELGQSKRNVCDHFRLLNTKLKYLNNEIKNNLLKQLQSKSNNLVTIFSHLDNLWKDAQHKLLKINRQYNNLVHLKYSKDLECTVVELQTHWNNLCSMFQPFRDNIDKALVMSNSPTKSSENQLTNQLTTNTILLRFSTEAKQLTKWLNTISNVLETSQAKLGDRFDQELVSHQLQEIKQAVADGTLSEKVQTFHPATIQMKIKQFLTELEARKPQLERMRYEKERLVDFNSKDTFLLQFAEQIDQLHKQWDSIEKQMIERSTQLDQMLNGVQSLKELEREVECEIAKIETELQIIDPTRVHHSDQNLSTSRRLIMSPDACRKHLQDLLDSLPIRNIKISTYRKECEGLMERFPNEDLTKLHADMENLMRQWNVLERSIKEAELSLTANSQHKLDERRTSSTDTVHKPNLNEQLNAVEMKFNHIYKLESELRNDTVQIDPKLLAEKRQHLVVEAQSLQSEINRIASQIANNSKSSVPTLNNLPNQEFFKRLKLLRDKMATLRFNMQSSSSQASLYLNRLKELNSWLGHRDAAFREIVGPLPGNLGNVVSLREQLLNLFRELDTNRIEIEDIICRDNLIVQQSTNPFYNASLTSEHESELESDCSDKDLKLKSPHSNDLNDLTISNNNNNLDNRSVRTGRRIRRHFYYLKKRWFNLNNDMLDFKGQLDAAWERLSNFSSLLNDAMAQVQSANAVAAKWIPVDSLPNGHLRMELNQTQSFYDACEPLAHSLDSLERQILQLQDSQIQIDSNLRAQLALIRNEFEQIRIVTQSRIHNLTQTLGAVRMLPQRPKYPSNIAFNSATHNQTIPQYTSAERDLIGSTPLLDSTPQNITVSLSDSVRLPWERCVHPNGTQVPYYKNHETQETQWDHPILCEIMRCVKQYNSIRFSDYRTGLKLRRLQKELCFDSITISLVVENLKFIRHTQSLNSTTFNHHHQTTDLFDQTISVPQIVDYLLQLFNQTKSLYDLTSKYSNGDGRISRKLDQSVNNQLQNCNQSQNVGDNINDDDVDDDGNELEAADRYATLSAPTNDIKTSSNLKICMGSFLRSSSTTRSCLSNDHRQMVKTNSKEQPNDGLKSLNLENRSSSLPVCAVMQAKCTEQDSSINRNAGHSSVRRKKQYVLGSLRRPINVCVDLILNWLLNIYDRMRRGSIRVLSFKVALALMSMSNLDEKFRYLFSLIADRDGCVDEQRLNALLYECVLIPRSLGETGQLGQGHFTQCVKQCFEQVLDISRQSDKVNDTLNHHPKSSIKVVHFFNWLSLNPQLLTWIPLLHRLSIAEQVVHHVRCSVCHNQPLIGLRYRCLRCLNYDMCQQCFFAGRSSRCHKLTHPMQEYCSHSTSSDSLRDFTRIVRNRFRSKERLKQNSDNQTNTANNIPKRSSSFNKGKRRGQDVQTFEEDKPRLAPTFNKELAQDFTEYQYLDTPTLDETTFKTGTIEDTIKSDTQYPSNIYRPNSNITQSDTQNNLLLPNRASSESHTLLPRQNKHNLDMPSIPVVPAHSTTPKPGLNNEIEQNKNKFIDSEEHKLIAHYSQELRQQSEPELNHVRQDLIAVSMTSSTGPMVMERSTISDGLPTSLPEPNIERYHPPHVAGHLSLDRRHMNRNVCFPRMGYPMDSIFRGSYSGWISKSQAGPGPYGQLAQPFYENSIYTDHPAEVYPRQIQRAFSLRARSQPPPELQDVIWKQNIGSNIASRSPSYQAAYDPNSPYYGQVQQTVRSLEDERRALQYEYDRLRQRSMTPTNITGSYGTMNRYQYMRSNRPFIPSPYPSQPHQIDTGRVIGMNKNVAVRSSPYRIMSASGQFASGPLYSGGPTFPGQMMYGSGLERANSASNDIAYNVDAYNLQSHPTTVQHYPNQITETGEVAAEARLLREHKGRLEARMQLLEEHNRQLEHQLQRLRQFVVTGGSTGDGNGRVVHSDTVNITQDCTNAQLNQQNQMKLRQRSSSGGLNANETKQQQTVQGSVILPTNSSMEHTPIKPGVRPVAQRSHSERSQPIQSHVYYPVTEDQGTSKY